MYFLLPHSSTLQASFLFFLYSIRVARYTLACIGFFKNWCYYLDRCLCDCEDIFAILTNSILVYSLVIRRWTWSATIPSLAVSFEQCSSGTKGPKVCQGHFPHTITPTAAWTFDGRTFELFGRMNPFFHVVCAKFLLSECYILDSSDRASFVQCSVVQFWWACINCSLSFCCYNGGVLPFWSSAVVAYFYQALMHLCSHMLFCRHWLYWGFFFFFFTTTVIFLSILISLVFLLWPLA